MNAVTTPVLHPSSAAVETPSGPVGMDSAERIMVTAALAGDDEAFETVIRTYSRRVYVVAYAIVQDVAEAEDIVQDTFLKAHNQRAKLREAGKFPAWLLAVARNGALRYCGETGKRLHPFRQRGRVRRCLRCTRNHTKHHISRRGLARNAGAS